MGLKICEISHLFLPVLMMGSQNSLTRIIRNSSKIFQYLVRAESGTMASKSMTIDLVLLLTLTLTAANQQKNITKRHLSLVSRFTSNPLFHQFFSHHDNRENNPHFYYPDYSIQEDNYYVPGPEDSRQTDETQHFGSYFKNYRVVVPEVTSFKEETKKNGNIQYVETLFNKLPLYDIRVPFRVRLVPIKKQNGDQMKIDTIFNKLPLYDIGVPFGGRLVPVSEKNENQMKNQDGNFWGFNVNLFPNVKNVERLNFEDFKKLPFYDRNNIFKTVNNNEQVPKSTFKDLQSFAKIDVAKNFSEAQNFDDFKKLPLYDRRNIFKTVFTFKNDDDVSTFKANSSNNGNIEKITTEVPKKIDFFKKLPLYDQKNIFKASPALNNNEKAPKSTFEVPKAFGKINFSNTVEVKGPIDRPFNVLPKNIFKTSEELPTSTSKNIEEPKVYILPFPDKITKNFVVTTTQGPLKISPEFQTEVPVLPIPKFQFLEVGKRKIENLEDISKKSEETVASIKNLSLEQFAGFTGPKIETNILKKENEEKDVYKSQVETSEEIMQFNFPKRPKFVSKLVPKIEEKKSTGQIFVSRTNPEMEKPKTKRIKVVKYVRRKNEKKEEKTKKDPTSFREVVNFTRTSFGRRLTPIAKTPLQDNIDFSKTSQDSYGNLVKF